MFDVHKNIFYESNVKFQHIEIIFLKNSSIKTWLNQYILDFCFSFWAKSFLLMTKSTKIFHLVEIIFWYDAYEEVKQTCSLKTLYSGKLFMSWTQYVYV